MSPSPSEHADEITPPARSRLSHVTAVRKLSPPRGTIVDARLNQRIPEHAHLLTVTEAAELLRTPVGTLRYWRHLGTGPNSFRLGRRVLYRAADIEVWIKEHLDTEAARRSS